MSRAAAILAACLTAVACEPPESQADAAPPSQEAVAPEYLNPNPRAPYSEGVRYGIECIAAA